jgi:hypothetical protein
LAPVCYSFATAPLRTCSTARRAESARPSARGKSRWCVLGRYFQAPKSSGISLLFIYYTKVHIRQIHSTTLQSQNRRKQLPHPRGGPAGRPIRENPRKGERRLNRRSRWELLLSRWSGPLEITWSGLLCRSTIYTVVCRAELAPTGLLPGPPAIPSRDSP